MGRPAASLPTQEELARVFRYDRETGELYWTGHESINPRMRGKVALDSRASNGYRFGAYRGQYLARHRVIYKLVNGVDPEEVDHADGDVANNRVENLRSVSHVENCRNRKRYSTNSSGVTGVSISGARWMAYIHIDKRMKNLGTFDTKDEAIAARKAAEDLLGYTVRDPYHG